MHFATVFLSLLVFSMLSGGANAQENWRTVCDESRCQLFNEIKTEDNNTVARLYFQNLEGAPEETGIMGIASLPLGLFIPSGVALDVDDDLVFRGELLECDQREGCRAAFKVTPEILEAMKKGGEMSVAIVDAQSRRTIAFNFSLMGFTKAYGEFAARM